MKVLVAGGRDYANRACVIRTLDQIAMEHLESQGEDVSGNWMPHPSFAVIHGGCNCGPGDPSRGADRFADEWCVVNWVNPLVFPADWKQHGRAAGPIRNRQMLAVSRPDLVVLFPGGRGTANLKELAVKAKFTSYPELKIMEIT